MQVRCVFAAVTAASFACFIGGALAQSDDIRTERVQFAPGATSATIEDSIKGYNAVDYVLGASAGQLMNVSMATDNGANYFNIIAPGETDVAMFIGSTSGTQFEGVLPATGDYKIRVYLMRSAARRDEVANYRLEMIISASDQGAVVPDTDAKVAGTDFHATGMIPCKQAKGQPIGQCDFGVIREGNGSGTVVVSLPNGGQRALFFQGGTATGSDASEADGGRFKATREGDLTVVHIGHERYEIPDAVIYGG